MLLFSKLNQTIKDRGAGVISKQDMIGIRSTDLLKGATAEAVRGEMTAGHADKIRMTVAEMRSARRIVKSEF